MPFLKPKSIARRGKRGGEHRKFYTSKFRGVINGKTDVTYLSTLLDALTISEPEGADSSHPLAFEGYDCGT